MTIRFLFSLLMLNFPYIIKLNSFRFPAHKCKCVRFHRKIPKKFCKYALVRSIIVYMSFFFAFAQIFSFWIEKKRRDKRIGCDQPQLIARNVVSTNVFHFREFWCGLKKNHFEMANKNVWTSEKKGAALHENGMTRFCAIDIWILSFI